jgi:hypothetical protein
MKLYEIVEEVFKLWDEESIIEDAQFAEREEKLQELLKSKSTSIIAFYKDMQHGIDAMKQEESRLNERRKYAEKRLESFKSYVLHNMGLIGVAKVETALGSLTIAQCPQSIAIIDESKIPDEWIKTDIVKRVNKKDLLTHIKSTGEVIDGVELVQNTSLRVR